jgi:hypothetical protein
MSIAACLAWWRETCVGAASKRPDGKACPPKRLRCAILKQYRQLSYQELAFHLEDAASFRAFARLPWSWSPQKSVLQKTISAIGPETWEAINRALLSGRSRRSSKTARSCGWTAP